VVHRLTATLATLPGLAPDPVLAGPTLIIVGEVVALAPRLAWFAGASAARDALLSDADRAALA
jgi:hypothetical protein